jgi:hypothetical protein
MVLRKIEVTRYFSCDGKEFAFSDACREYERELKVQIYYEICKSRVKIKTLKQKANEKRLQFLVAKLDAIDASNDGKAILFHEKMIEYYKAKTEYHVYESDLHFERIRLSEFTDKFYMWFGEMKHKSEFAKQNRREKSLHWRKENTPDKWRTPYKIRVSKLPKEDNNE